MARSRFSRKSILNIGLSVFVGVAVVGCGTQTGAGSGVNGATTKMIEARPFCVAPVDGSPEEAAFGRGHCSSYSSYAAPIEGSPEQTAADLGR
jgi:hypothetical protein